MTPAEFKVRYPRFASKSDPVIQQELDDAAPELDASRWGARYDKGLGLLVAHRLALGDQANSDPFYGTGSGTTTTKEVGSVKLTRAASFSGKDGGSDELDLTLYGQQFKALRRQVGRGAISV